MTGIQAGGHRDIEFVIEEVTDLDAVWPDLRELFLALHRYHEPWLTRRFRPDWEARWRDYIQPGPDKLVLLARHRVELLGYLSAEIRRDYGLFEELVGFINEAFVTPELRGQGIGRALVRRCEDWSRTRGATQLDLTVVLGNQLGLDFWSRSGFSPISYRMSKPLEASV